MAIETTTGSNLNGPILPTSGPASGRNGLNAGMQRSDFSKIRTSARIPNLIEIQRESYDRFLQMDLLPPERDNTGLQAVFRSTFPISDFRDTSSLEFVEYRIATMHSRKRTHKGG